MRDPHDHTTPPHKRQLLSFSACARSPPPSHAHRTHRRDGRREIQISYSQRFRPIFPERRDRHLRHPLSSHVSSAVSGNRPATCRALSWAIARPRVERCLGRSPGHVSSAVLGDRPATCRALSWDGSVFGRGASIIWRRGAQDGAPVRPRRRRRALMTARRLLRVGLDDGSVADAAVGARGGDAVLLALP